MGTWKWLNYVKLQFISASAWLASSRTAWFAAPVACLHSKRQIYGLIGVSLNFDCAKAMLLETHPYLWLHTYGISWAARINAIRITIWPHRGKRDRLLHNHHTCQEGQLSVGLARFLATLHNIHNVKLDSHQYKEHPYTIGMRLIETPK